MPLQPVGVGHINEFLDGENVLDGDLKERECRPGHSETPASRACNVFDRRLSLKMP